MIVVSETRFHRIRATSIGLNPFQQKRTVSWLISILRRYGKSSTLRSESGNRTHISTTRRMTLSEVMKQQKGKCRASSEARPGSCLAHASFTTAAPHKLILPSASCRRSHCNPSRRQVRTQAVGEFMHRIATNFSSGCRFAVTR
jgi:hypothetical protein